MRFVAAGLSDIGRLRGRNEDSFLLLPEFQVYVVADGIGGHEAGDVASRMASTRVASYFREGLGLGREVGDGLVDALIRANDAIFRADEERAHFGMGTTVVAAAFSRDGHHILIAHAGDSRCYRLRASSLTRLTRDHSLIEDALTEDPGISHAELSSLPKNVITRALGVDPEVEIEVRREKVEAGDVYLLCSDGLHGLLPDEEIEALLSRHLDVTEACSELVRRANDRGGFDNITVVAMRAEDG